MRADIFCGNQCLIKNWMSHGWRIRGKREAEYVIQSFWSNLGRFQGHLWVWERGLSVSEGTRVTDLAFHSSCLIINWCYIGDREPGSPVHLKEHCHHKLTSKLNRLHSGDHSGWVWLFFIITQCQHTLMCVWKRNGLQNLKEGGTNLVQDFYHFYTSCDY